jgi:hypothetical protein
MKNNSTASYDTAFVIRNSARRFLTNSETSAWGSIGESQLFDNYYAAREIAGRIKGAGVRHVMLKPIKR